MAEARDAFSACARLPFPMAREEIRPASGCKTCTRFEKCFASIEGLSQVLAVPGPGSSRAASGFLAEIYQHAVVDVMFTSMTNDSGKAS